MGTGKELRDRLGFGDYVREHVLPLAPEHPLAPFRGRVGDSPNERRVFDDVDEWLRGAPGRRCAVAGPAGIGKSLFLRRAAVHWGQLFLDAPDEHPLPVLKDAVDEGLPSLPRVDLDRVARHHPTAFVICTMSSGCCLSATTRLRV